MKIEIVELKPVENFTREIGLFLASLEKIRSEWRESVKDLTKTELAAKILLDVQPIGTLIMHIAEAEYFWIQEIVSSKPMSDEIKDLLHHDLWFKDFGAEDLEVEYCLEVVEKIHVMTRGTLSEFTDEDVEKLFIRKEENSESHFSLRWIFTHLLQHDAEHQGQIMMIKRLLRKR
jgi:uncharacterized damage-inducible protein DinB